MNELKRNASGYYDPTAYKAIMNIGEREDGQMKDIKAGEIYEYETVSGYTRKCVVLAAHESASTILNLTEEKKVNTVEVNAGSIMFTNPQCLQYVFNDKLTGFVRELSNEELDRLMTLVCCELGAYTKSDIETAYESAYEKAKKDCANKNEALRSRVRELEKEKSENSINPDYIRIETERNLYKQMYEQTLEKLIG